MAAEERSTKFLLRDELLHQYGLLHASRSTHPHEVPDSPPKALDAPVSTDEPIPKEPASEASLVMCSTAVDVAGSSGKFALAPVIEEEEPLRCSEDAAGLEAEKETPAELGGDDTFEGLSDLMITSQELFKDDLITTKVISSAIEATSILQQAPSTQELTPAAKVDVNPKPKSGL